jgi:hypothetical protein
MIQLGLRQSLWLALSTFFFFFPRWQESMEARRSQIKPPGTHIKAVLRSTVLQRGKNAVSLDAGWVRTVGTITETKQC